MGQGPSAGNPKLYELLFNPDVTGSGDNLIVLNFDIMSFDWNDDVNSWLYLEEALVEEVMLTSPTEIQRFDFTGGTDGWQHSGQIPPYDASQSSSGGSNLGLTALGSTNCFGFWFSPDVAIENGKYYRTIFDVGSLAAASDDTVQFRLRTNQKGSWQAWERIVNSNNNQSPPPMKLYHLIFDPDVTGSGDANAVFSFDIMSFDINDDADKWIYCESVVLEEVIINP
jgi:hypothetical protein